MTDMDKSFVAAFLNSDEPRVLIRKAADLGIGEEDIHGEGGKAYEFVVSYICTYGELPSSDMVFAKTGVKLPKAEGTAEYYLNELYNRKLHSELSLGLQKPILKLKHSDSFGALEDLEELMMKIRQGGFSDASLKPLNALGLDVLDFYKRMKNGETGILTPWPSMNDATMGFWPEDVILFVARAGVGKSWLMLILAHSIWKSGKKVLFVTTEMSQLSIAVRWACLVAGVSHYRLRHGMLSEFAEKRLEDRIQAVLEDKNIMIVGGDFDFRMPSFVSAIQECKPDIAFLDGVYLMLGSGENERAKISNVYNDIKRTSKREKIPIVLSTQFNREVKSNSSKVALENISATDVSGWVVSMAVGLYQTEDMRSDRKMGFKLLKVREGSGKDFECTWDLDNIKFDEIDDGEGISDANDADDYGITTGQDVSVDDVPF